MSVKFTLQSSPSLFWVLTKCPGRESSARKNPHPIVLLSICWLWPWHLKHLGHLKSLNLTRSSMPSRETPKATWEPGFLWCCQRGPPVPKTWAVEQRLGTLDHTRSPAAAVAHYPRAPQLSLNIHMRLTGSSPVVSKSPEAAWAG